MAKRKIFTELIEGVEVMKAHREGKLTLRSYKVEAAPLPAVNSKFIRETRKRMRCSRAVFARKLRINVRTLEKWEQGRAKPNPQAAALVLLVRMYPDTLERLEKVAAGCGGSASFTSTRNFPHSRKIQIGEKAVDRDRTKRVATRIVRPIANAF